MISLVNALSDIFGVKTYRIVFSTGLVVRFFLVGRRTPLRTVGYVGVKYAIDEESGEYYDRKFRGVRFSLSPTLMDRPWLTDYNKWSA